MGRLLSHLTGQVFQKNGRVVWRKENNYGAAPYFYETAPQCVDQLLILLLVFIVEELNVGFSQVLINLDLLVELFLGDVPTGGNCLFQALWKRQG